MDGLRQELVAPRVVVVAAAPGTKDSFTRSGPTAPEPSLLHREASLELLAAPALARELRWEGTNHGEHRMSHPTKIACDAAG